MKKIFFVMAVVILPLFLKSQVTDLTISPDSLFFDSTIYNTMTLTNNTAQPINLLSVQQHCIACVGNWYWQVDTMSVSTPNWINPGQSISIVVMAWGGIKSALTDYKHSTMAIQSSVGLQYCHIFLNSSLISAMAEKSESHLYLYPNPAASTITIKSNKNSDPIKFIEIYNSIGRPVFQTIISDDNLTFSVEAFPNGLYFAKIQTPRHTYISRFLKK